VVIWIARNGESVPRFVARRAKGHRSWT